MKQTRRWRLWIWSTSGQPPGLTRIAGFPHLAGGLCTEDTAQQEVSQRELRSPPQQLCWLLRAKVQEPQRGPWLRRLSEPQGTVGRPFAHRPGDGARPMTSHTHSGCHCTKLRVLFEAGGPGCPRAGLLLPLCGKQRGSLLPRDPAPLCFCPARLTGTGRTPPAKALGLFPLIMSPP